MLLIFINVFYYLKYKKTNLKFINIKIIFQIFKQKKNILNKKIY